jgi:hypothetical protein
MTLVISELYIALEKAGFPRELARAAADIDLPARDQATKNHLIVQLAEAFQQCGVNSALAIAPPCRSLCAPPPV